MNHRSAYTAICEQLNFKQLIQIIISSTACHENTYKNVIIQNSDNTVPSYIIYLLASCRLYGDYESLSQGYTADALVDFTGGVAEKLFLPDINFQVENTRTQLFRDVMAASENKALITACIAVGDIFTEG